MPKSIAEWASIKAVEPLLAAVVLGAVAAVIGIMLQISLATLLYTGDLAPFLGAGIGTFLAGTLIMALVGSLTSSFPNTIIYAQEMPAMLLALAAGSIVASARAASDPQAHFYTVVVLVALSTLLTGLFFLLLGRFKLGNLIRYLPYPVVGGFLAGTGWLMVAGGIAVMSEIPVTLATLTTLLQPEVLARWLPGLVLASTALLLLRRYNHFLILPSLLTVAIGLCYMVLSAQGIPVATAQSQGWLLGPFPADSLWTPLSPINLAQVQWSAILAHSDTIGTVMLLSLVAVLLNISGMELSTGRDLDLNRELRTAGLANLAGGLGGGPTGFHALGLSNLAHSRAPDTRLVGIVFALLVGFTLLRGTAILSYIPTFVAGGLVLYLGLDFLAEWAYDTWFRLSHTDYAIVILIALAMNMIGVLAGVALGMLVAVILFVVDYSRISAIKHALSSRSYRSNVDRPLVQQQVLRAHGEEIYILQLQGFLFFGTAHTVFEQLHQRLAEKERPHPRFVVLDFRQARGLDASAALSIGKMVQVAQRHNFLLLFSHLSHPMEQRLRREILTTANQAVWRIFPDLDHAMEWCEEQILQVAQCANAFESPQTFEQFLTMLLHNGKMSPSHASRAVAMVMDYVERLDVAAGHSLITQGDDPTGLYFIAAGQSTAQVETEDGRVIRLRTMQPGTVIGELSLYTGTTASASVVTLEPSTVYFLAAARLAQMEAQDPQVAVALHRAIAYTVSGRLIDATDVVRTLPA